MMVTFILSEVTEDERARWMRMLVVLALGGLLLLFAPDVVRFLTDISIPTTPPSCPSGGGSYYVPGLGYLPCHTVRALSQIFLLARFLGIAAVAAGGGFAVFKL